MTQASVRPIDSKRSRAGAGENGADLQARLEAWRGELAHADRQLRATARERPFLVVGTALVAGYLLGRALAGR